MKALCRLPRKETGYNLMHYSPFFLRRGRKGLFFLEFSDGGEEKCRTILY